VPTHVALLRGVNVGGKKLAMADLREAVAGLGHTGVSTYIQSGNVLFTTGERDTAALAAGIERAIAQRAGIESRVVVLPRGELAEVVRGNPYPGEPNPKLVHVLFPMAGPTPELAGVLAEAQRQVMEKGSRDTARLEGRAVFLHTPDGYGRSELAVLLGRLSGRKDVAWTARNWATVTKLLALCDA
jgi:uncharacterized protein (DUF1697 family)